VLRGAPVTEVVHDGGALAGVVTPQGTIRAGYVVNAAGLGAGRIAELAGGEDLRTWPRKGEYLLVDREVGRRLRTIVFCTPLPGTKGVNVVPTTHGSLQLGPTGDDHGDADDRSTVAASLDGVFARTQRLVPSLRREHVIKAYAANRPASDERFRLRIDARVPNLLHATDRSAGVSISPAIGGHALELLREAGLDAEDRADAVDALPAVPRLRTDPRPERLTALDPQYGQVVCACEQVSAAEIAAALAGPVGARSVEGVRKRTGATYGRCQGAICLAGVSFLCAMATGTGPAGVALTERGALGA
jgi:glycerol-3-phosphate dehydrogenase